MLEGVDYSTDRPSPAELVAAGKHFAVRYVSSPGRTKNLTRAEADALQAAGIAIGIVFEITASRALGSRATGAYDAASARSQVRDLGGPQDGGVIYFAVDFDAQPGQMGTVLGYGQGWADVLGKDRCGPYGSYRVCKAFLDAGFAYGFQTYAWSAGQFDPRAQLQQYRNGVTLGSGTVDLCRATADDYGQWKEADVPLSDEEIDKVADRVATRLGLRDGTRVADAKDVALVLRGDDAHPDSLRALRAAVDSLALGLSDAQVDALIAGISAKVAITGHPSFTITGEATPKAAP